MPASRSAISSTSFCLMGLRRLESAPSSCWAATLRLDKRLRVDQVADRLGLGEIEASVEEGAHGELAGFGEARAAGERQFDDMAKNDGRAVGGDFDDVVGGVGVGLLERR